MRPLNPTERLHAALAVTAVAVATLLGTFTHIVSQAAQDGAARYTAPSPGAAATKPDATRQTASAHRP